jgi:uncharacterized protein (UPF0332 family)
VSPRSQELLDAARRRLAAAGSAIHDDPSTALSAAYYAIFYAVRAALSERDIYARTHAGIWHEFHRTFVTSGEFEESLAADAHAVQPEREQADYEAWAAPREEAQRVIDLAETFLAAIDEMLAA